MALVKETALVSVLETAAEPAAAQGVSAELAGHRLPPAPNLRWNPITPMMRAGSRTGEPSLDAVVNADGSMSVMRWPTKVVTGLTMRPAGLSKYFKCKPGLYEGKAVATSVKIDVNFHLY